MEEAEEIGLGIVRHRGCVHYIRRVFALSEVMCGDGTDKHQDGGTLCVG